MDLPYKMRGTRRTLHPKPIRTASCHINRQYYARGLCKECYDQRRHTANYAINGEQIRARMKGYYTRNKEHIYRRELKRKFGITPEQYDQMLADQHDLCALCGQPQKDGRRDFLCVDHDHETKEVRGLLCITCNAGLGQFNDNLELLEKAVAYLKRHLRSQPAQP